LGDSGGGGNWVAGAAGTKEWNVFRLITALGFASAATLATAAVSAASNLDSKAPWWERVTVTISGDGQPQGCRFESSLKPGDATNCEVQSSQAAMAKTSSGSKDSYTRITFERRFSPGQPDPAGLPTGDKLLGQQVMALAIGAKGTVEGCRIVSADGDMRPDYGCKEASAEKFQARAQTGTSSTATHEGYMTILVYGHSEHVV
jgi:hypothetical protein